MTAADSPAVSVIVLTYNARSFVERCLSALFAQSYTAFEVIVVDNASMDGTAEFIRDRFRDARLIVSPRNGGYGAGNNLAAAQAAGDILVFLNPDAVPAREWLTELIGGMRRYGSKFATSRIVLQADPDRLNSGGNLIHYLGLSFCRGLKAPWSKYDKPEFVSGASGAACAIARDLFQRIGGFDPSFFLYHDDVDLSLRALLAGERCLYVPGAIVAHDYDLSVPPAKWGWIEAHRYAVLLKTLSLRTIVVLTPVLVALDIVTFAYLAWRGPAFVRAKLGSYAWILRHAGTIYANRRLAQRVRVVSDRHILGELTDRIPYEQLASPLMAMLAARLVDPWFQLYRQLCLSFIRW